MSNNAKWKKIFSKKWTFPAIYLTAAVLILALMWWYQDPNEYPLTKGDLGLEEVNPMADGSSNEGIDVLLQDKLGEEAVSVSKPVEILRWPVANQEDVQFGMSFFDTNATDQDMEKSIVSFENELWPHSGIDITSSDGKEFSVLAALSGEVVRAEKDPVVGFMVELKHENGLTTSYSSLVDVQVAKGDQVRQGEMIGSASRNIFEKDAGVHLHFEISKDGLVMNPNLFISQDPNKVIEDLTTIQ